MDKLYLSAKYYKDFLLDKDFHIQAGNRKKELLEFDVIFRTEHFNHLIGFNKLKDIQEANMFGYNVLDNVLNGKLTFDYISNSEYLSLMENRLDNFMLLRETIFTDKIMLGKTKPNSFNTIKADFLLTKDCDFGLVNLFLKEGNPGLAIPVTFFTTDHLRYLDTTKWTILSVTEINVKKESTKTISEKELIDINNYIRHGKQDKSNLEGTCFIYNRELYRIDSIDVNLQLGRDSAIISRISDDGEMKFFEKDFASQPKLKLSLTPLNKFESLIDNSLVKNK